MTDREILDAASTLLAPHVRNIYGNRMPDYNVLQGLEEQLGSTHNSLSSLEAAQEEISMGARKNGRMSVVRRFFCLFVLFDLLLISMTWLIYVVLLGSDRIIENLKIQILCYNIQSSIFDIVLAAFCRFAILLLFYGLLQFNTTFFVSFTTVATCVFLICKIIYYSWNTASQPVLQVILVLMSFVIAWVEAWFLDYRVRPQEISASTYAQAISHFSDSLSTILLQRNLRNPVMRHFFEDMAAQMTPTESIRNFYSPLQSPNASSGEEDDEKTDRKKDQVVNIEPSNPSHSNRRQLGKRNQFEKKSLADMKGKDLKKEYVRWGEDTLEVAWSILKDRDWKLQKVGSHLDCVYSKYEPHIGKVFLLKARMKVNPKRLGDELFKNVERYTSWNKTLMESRRLQLIDEHTDITYQVSAPGLNGIISPRDFIVLRHWTMKEDWFVLGGISIPYPGLPPSKEFVRGENGPCCWAVKSVGDDNCEFQFLLNTDLKGWLSSVLVESALISVMLEYSTCLRNHCKTISSEAAT